PPFHHHEYRRTRRSLPGHHLPLAQPECSATGPVSRLGCAMDWPEMFQTFRKDDRAPAELSLSGRVSHPKNLSLVWLCLLSPFSLGLFFALHSGRSQSLSVDQFRHNHIITRCLSRNSLCTSPICFTIYK